MKKNNNKSECYYIVDGGFYGGRFTNKREALKCFRKTCDTTLYCTLTEVRGPFSRKVIRKFSW